MGQEGFLLPDSGQGLPANSAADAAPDDIVAVRLQCRLSWLLPLLDQAMVGCQACLVLPAHGPRLPDSGPPLKRVKYHVDVEAGVVHALEAGAYSTECLLVCPIFSCMLLHPLSVPLRR